MLLKDLNKGEKAAERFLKQTYCTTSNMALSQQNIFYIHIYVYLTDTFIKSDKQMRTRAQGQPVSLELLGSRAQL